MGAKSGSLLPKAGYLTGLPQQWRYPVITYLIFAHALKRSSRLLFLVGRCGCFTVISAIYRYEFGQLKRWAPFSIYRVIIP